MLVLGILLLAVVVLALPVLTGVGDRRRGHSLPHATLAGLFFPVAWAAWYVTDERPHRQ